MNKNTGTRTATTFNLPFILFPDVDPEAAEALTRPYVWRNEADARTAVARLDKHSDGHTEHQAPGLEVHAFYVAVPGRDELELYTVIVIEDDTAARLHKAVRRSQPVTVTYVKADGEETVRTIEPTGLSLTKAGDVIVKAADRKSGEKRSFRLDRVLFYTVHRTAFTVRTEAPAPTKAELVEAFRAPRVRLSGRDWTGHLVPDSKAFSATGWTAKMKLDTEFAHLAPSGTLRVCSAELIYI